MTQPYYKQRRSDVTDHKEPFEVAGTPVDVELGGIDEVMEGLADTVDHKVPLTPDESDPDADQEELLEPNDEPPTPEGGETVEPSPMDKAKAFLKEWWWAVAIAAYVAYKLWKGGKQ